MTVTERVQSGAELLDRKFPGWEGQISLDSLDLGDFTNCTVTQLYGSYIDGLEDLGFGGFAVCHYDGDEVDYGFDSYYADEYEYAELTAAWKALISQRRVS